MTTVTIVTPSDCFYQEVGHSEPVTHFKHYFQEAVQEKRKVTRTNRVTFSTDVSNCGVFLRDDACQRGSLPKLV